MYEIAPLIQDLAIILGIAGLVALLFQKIHQPLVLGYLLAGVVIGPYTPPYALVTDLPNIKTLSELGVIFLMFSLGLEFSFHKLKSVGFSATITGFFEVTGMLLLGFMTGLLIGWSFLDSLFLGAALSISSTTIIIKALEELKLKHKPFAQMIFGILIVEDLIAILLLAGLSIAVYTSNIFSLELAEATLKLLLVVGTWFLVGYFLVPSFFRRISPYLNGETLTIISIALCLFLVCVASYFHYSTALGAFIMGSILAETSLIHRIEPLIKPIRNIFAAVFFVSVGMMIDPMILYQHWVTLFSLCFITITGKLLFTGMAAFFSGQDLKTSTRIGLGMAQIGEFSFIIVGLGLALGVVSPELFPIIVGVSAITTFTTPYMIKYSGNISKELDKRLPLRVQYFINSYTDWIQQILKNPNVQPLYRRAISQLILNGVIVAVIFLTFENGVVPYFINIVHPAWLEKLLAWFIAILCSSPFIWGMLTSFQKSPLADKANEVSEITPGIQLSWLVTITALTILSIAYFDTWWISVLFLIVAATFFALMYKQLGKSYQWFENKLLYNLQHPSKKAKHTYILSQKAVLIELEVNEGCRLVGKVIKPHKLRRQYGVNVVAIARGTQMNLLSQSQHDIQLGDRLYVLGDDKNVDSFSKKMSLQLPIH